MKTTRQIINQTPKFDINNTKEKLDYHFNTKWYSEEEIKKAISKCYSYGHAEPLTEYYNNKDDNLICIAKLEEHLFTPDFGIKEHKDLGYKAVVLADDTHIVLGKEVTIMYPKKKELEEE